jgi:predicted metal-binding protein
VPVPGEVLADATLRAAEGTGIAVCPIRCLANCNRGLSAAVRRNGAWTYVFGNLDPADGADALIEGAKLFAGAPDGLMPWRGRPDALKRGLVARTPPFDFAGDCR